MIKSPYSNNFNEVRVVALMETKPISDQYVQIMLTEKQKVKLLDLLNTFMVKEDDNVFVVPAQDEEIHVPDVKHFFSQEEIDAVADEE